MVGATYGRPRAFKERPYEQSRFYSDISIRLFYHSISYNTNERETYVSRSFLLIYRPYSAFMLRYFSRSMLLICSAVTR